MAKKQKEQTLLQQDVKDQDMMSRHSEGVKTTEESNKDTSQDVSNRDVSLTLNMTKTQVILKE